MNGLVVDDSTAQPVRGVQIINTTTIHRWYGDSSGHFLLQGLRTDTFVFLARGYAARRLVFGDTLQQTVRDVVVTLRRLQYELPEVRVAPARSFEEVRRDAAKTRFDRSDYLLQGSDQFVHPLTYLYQLLSKRERDRRAYAELVMQDRERALIAELLNGYRELNLLRVEAEQLPSFIDFLQQNNLLQFSLTEYEFIRNLQRAEKMFERSRRHLPYR